MKAAAPSTADALSPRLTSVRSKPDISQVADATIVYVVSIDSEKQLDSGCNRLGAQLELIQNLPQRGRTLILIADTLHWPAYAWKSQQAGTLASTRSSDDPDHIALRQKGLTWIQENATHLRGLGLHVDESGTVSSSDDGQVHLRHWDCIEQHPATKILTEKLQEEYDNPAVTGFSTQVNKVVNAYYHRVLQVQYPGKEHDPSLRKALVTYVIEEVAAYGVLAGKYGLKTDKGFDLSHEAIWSREPLLSEGFQYHLYPGKINDAQGSFTARTLKPAFNMKWITLQLTETPAFANLASSSGLFGSGGSSRDARGSRQGSINTAPTTPPQSNGRDHSSSPPSPQSATKIRQQIAKSKVDADQKREEAVQLEQKGMDLEARLQETLLVEKNAKLKKANEQFGLLFSVYYNCFRRNAPQEVENLSEILKEVKRVMPKGNFPGSGLEVSPHAGQVEAGSVYAQAIIDLYGHVERVLNEKSEGEEAAQKNGELSSLTADMFELLNAYLTIAFEEDKQLKLQMQTMKSTLEAKPLNKGETIESWLARCLPSGSPQSTARGLSPSPATSATEASPLRFQCIERYLELTRQRREKVPELERPLQAGMTAYLLDVIQNILSDGNDDALETGPLSLEASEAPVAVMAR